MGSSSDLQHHTGEPRVRPSAYGGAWGRGGGAYMVEPRRSAINDRENMAADPRQGALSVSRSMSASRRRVRAKPHRTTVATSSD
jgi:hypothetical protein